MVLVVKSLVDTYKDENKKIKLKCKFMEDYIDVLEKQKEKLEDENKSYRILLKNQLEEK